MRREPGPEAGAGAPVEAEEEAMDERCDPRDPEDEEEYDPHEDDDGSLDYYGRDPEED